MKKKENIALPCYPGDVLLSAGAANLAALAGAPRVPRPLGGRPARRGRPRRAADTHFFVSSRRRHTRLQGDWSSDVCSSDLRETAARVALGELARRFLRQVLGA